MAYLGSDNQDTFVPVDLTVFSGLMTTNGTLKITDFGLAKIHFSDDADTSHGGNSAHKGTDPANRKND